MRLRTSEFDQAADQCFGADATDAQVAEHLGIDKTSLSLYRNDRRQPPHAFIATVLDTFPDARYEDFFEHVGAESVAS